MTVFHTCSPEIQQDRVPVFDHDVIRRDIPVQDVFLMDPAQCCQHRIQQSQQFPFRDLSPFLCHGFQGLTVHILHHDIGRPVLAENMVGMDHIRQLVQLPEGNCLPVKEVQALAVGLPASFRHRQHFAFADFRPCDIPIQLPAGDQAIGVKLLDGNDLLHVQVKGFIGDAKATLAQHRPDLVAGTDDRARMQRFLDPRVFAFLIAAVTHTAFRQWFKAIRTSFHTFLHLSQGLLPKAAVPQAHHHRSSQNTGRTDTLPAVTRLPAV